MPEIKIVCIKITPGRKKIKGLNFIPKGIIKINISPKLKIKSTKFTTTIEMGISSRGKYTFFIRFPLSKRLIVDVDIERFK